MLSSTSNQIITAATLAGAGLQPVTDYTVPSGANVLRVGADKAFHTLASALAMSRNGDVLLVDAGTYVNDFATIRSKVSIIGVGGMVNLVATQAPPNGKAILTVDTDALIQNVSFSGAAVPDANGAGIRYEGGSLTLRNCSFHNNENGLMSAAVPGGTLLIQHCDFGHNGNGNGLTHNLYAGGIKQLTIEDSVFHDAVVGHEIKSRALNTTITGSVISDGPDGTASYSIDLPNGGKGLISGNLIYKGPQAENQAIIHFGGEGIPYAGSSLLVTGNQVTNDRGPGAVAVLNHTAIPVTVTGNSLTRLDPTHVVAGPGRSSANLDSPGADGTGTVMADLVLSGILPGRTQVFTDALDHAVTLTSSDTAVQGGAGRLQVSAVAGHVIVQGGVGGLDYADIQGSGGNQVTTASGAANTVVLTGQDGLDSQGVDAIVTGSGNVTAQVSGSATIQEGTGYNQWSVLGNARITGHGGAPRVSLGDTASVALDGALDFFAVQSNGGTATYDISLGGTPVQASLSGGFYLYGSDGRTSITTAGGDGGVLAHLGAGEVHVVSAGHDVIWAGSGPTAIQASGPAEVHAGTGTLALYGHGYSGASLWGAGGTYVIGGDSGGITYHGGSQDSTVQADLSGITLLGGDGRMTVHAGYNQTIVGGHGGITVSEQASGANSITTQAGSANTVSLTNGTLDSWGGDIITEPGGNNTVSVHGRALIKGSTGNSGLTVFGRATLLGQGGDWVAVQPGGTADLTAGGYLHATTEQATLRITVPGGAAPAATALIQGGSAWAETGTGRGIHIETAAVLGGTAVSLDGAASQVWSYGADSIHTGAGSANVFLCADAGDVWGGAGQLAVQNRSWGAGSRHTVHGGDGSVTVEGSGTNLTFIGGAGDAVLDGGGQSLTIQGGSGRITVVNPWALGLTFTGGSGDAVLNVSGAGGSVTFGTGNTTVHEVDWGAPVTYTITGAGGGTQTIAGFRPGTDVLRLAGTGVAGVSSSSEGTTLITTAGARLVLQAVSGPVSPVLVAAPAPLPSSQDDSGAGVAPAPGPATAAPPATPLATPAATDPQPAPAPALSPASASPAPSSSVPAVLPPGTASSASASPATDPAATGTVMPNPAPAAPPVIASAPPQAAQAPSATPAQEVAPAPAATAPAAAIPATDTRLAPQPSPAPDVAPAVLVPPAAAILTADPAPASAVQAVPSIGSAPGVTTAVPPAPVLAPSPAGVAQPSAADVAADPIPAPPAPAAQPAAPAFEVIQTATGQAAHTDGDSYTGPVASLQRQFIWSGEGNVVIAASTPDVFLHGGSGDDALAVHGGTNVLDGGAGSNFLVGSTGADGGTDTFFVDGRGGQTWSTLVNFHHGDALTFWGFQQGVSTQAWTPSEGAAGYTGVTLHSELAGAGTGVNASATFAGLTNADLAKLTVQTGTVGGLGYLNIAYTG